MVTVCVLVSTPRLAEAGLSGGRGNISNDESRSVEHVPVPSESSVGLTALIADVGAGC